jgi:hypothetical protein
MTPPSFISHREFDAWRQSHDAKVDRILDHLERQTERNLAVEGRVTALEVNQLNAGKLSAKISGAMGAIVAAIVTGIFALLSAAR